MKNNILILSLIFLLSAQAYAQSQFSSATIKWKENGVWYSNTYYLNSLGTISPDQGSPVNITVTRTSNANLPAKFIVWDVNNVQTHVVESSQTSQLFTDCIGPLNTVIRIGVNSMTEFARIIVTWTNPPKPDLTMSTVLVDGSLSTSGLSYYAGQTVNIIARVSNVGGAEATSSRLGLFIKTSKDNTSGSPATWERVYSVRPGSTLQYEFTYTFTSNDVGTRYFVFEADYANEVTEANETNNVKSFGPFTVVTPANLKLMPTTYSFGEVEVNKCSPEQDFILTNDGVTRASISTVSFGADSHFEIVSGGGSFYLDAGKSRTIKVRFCPQSAGTKNDILKIYSPGVNTPVTQASVAGSGTTPTEEIIVFSQKVIQLNVNQPPEFGFSISRSDTTILNTTSVVLGTDLVVYGGSGDYQFLWSPAETIDDPTLLNPVATPYNSAIYTLMAFDNGGCSFTLEYKVNVVFPLQVQAEITDAGCFGKNNGSVILSVSQGAPPYSYLWATGETTARISNLKAGLYQIVVTDSLGQTFTDEYEISEYKEIITMISATVCEGDSLSVGDMIYSQTGNYIDTLISVNNCDSIIHLALTVQPTYVETIEASVCQGGEYIFNGKAYHVTGLYADTLRSVHGCDSILNLALTVQPTYIETIEASVCQGEEYIFNGKAYHATGLYADALLSVNNCDSVILLNLVVKSLPDKPVISINGDTLTSSAINNKWYKDGAIIEGVTGRKLIIERSGNFWVSVSNENGCWIESDAVSVIYSSLITFNKSNFNCILFPNPNDGKFKLQITGPVTEKISLIISDNNGKMVKSQSINNFTGSHTEYFQMNFVSGVYYLWINTGTETITKQFIIQ